MARAKKHGPKHRIGGYVRGKDITTWDGRFVGKILKESCTRIKPGSRGSWISSERCSYTVRVNGRTYVGTGYGEGMAVTLRQTAALNGLAGHKRRRR